MQSKYQSHFIVRAQYYTSLSFYRQVHTPFKYEKLVPVIFIGVLDHILDDTHNDIISQHILMNSKHHTISSHHQVYYCVELPKFKKTLEECSSDVDAWLFFMKEADQFDKIPTKLQSNEKFQNAFHILERARWTELEFDKYLAEADRETEQERYIKGAEEKALRKGIEQGIQQEKEIVVMNLLKEGLSIQIIAKVTDLSIEQIEALNQ